MAAQGHQFLAAGCIPHLGRLVRTPCDQPLAVLAPGNAPYSGVMTAQAHQFPPAGGIPYLGHMVETSGRQELAVRAPGHAGNSVVVAVQSKSHTRSHNGAM